MKYYIMLVLLLVVLFGLFGLYTHRSKIYTLTTLADGRVQFDWGSKYHTRSGFDDRMWQKSTYDGLSEAIAKSMGYKSAKEADDAFANSLTSNCVRVTSLSGLWKK